MEVFLFIVKISIAAVAFKAIVGFHFPGEKCECCGYKWGDHKKTRGRITKITSADGDYFDTVYIDTDNSNTGLHIDKCVDFDPEVGDVVEINELDWTVRKI